MRMLVPLLRPPPLHAPAPRWHQPARSCLLHGPALHTHTRTRTCTRPGAHPPSGTCPPPRSQNATREPPPRGFGTAHAALLRSAAGGGLRAHRGSPRWGWVPLRRAAPRRVAPEVAPIKMVVTLRGGRGAEEGSGPGGTGTLGLRSRTKAPAEHPARVRPRVRVNFWVMPVVRRCSSSVVYTCNPLL